MMTKYIIKINLNAQSKEKQTKKKIYMHFVEQVKFNKKNGGQAVESATFTTKVARLQL